MDRKTRAQLLTTTTTVIAALTASVLGLLFAHFGGSTRVDLVAAAAAGWIIATTAIGRATEQPLVFRSLCLLIGSVVALPTVPLLRLAGIRITIAL